MGLHQFLISNENARKIFGKAELRIIKKQLLGVNLTQSEKNRLSRDIRKKFDFIGKVSGFEVEFKLKKGAEIEKMIEEAKKVILGDVLFNNIKKITLYGSAADNTLTLQSDIDLAVEIDQIDLKQATLFRKRISGLINERVDVQVYNYLPNKIKKEVDSKGKVSYLKNENKR